MDKFLVLMIRNILAKLYNTNLVLSSGEETILHNLIFGLNQTGVSYLINTVIYIMNYKLKSLFGN